MTYLDELAPGEATSAVRPRVELEIVRGRARNKVRRVDVPVFLIGSAHDCDLVLADPDFPEVHTYLYVNRGGVSVRWLGEGPELTVDGREVQSSPVVDGQRLTLGAYEFAVRIDRPSSIRREDAAHTPPAGPAGRAAIGHEGIAQVRLLLDDIRAMLRAESDLEQDADRPLPWRAVTAGKTLLVHKASA